MKRKIEKEAYFCDGCDERESSAPCFVCGQGFCYKCLQKMVGVKTALSRIYICGDCIQKQDPRIKTILMENENINNFREERNKIESHYDRRILDLKESLERNVVEYEKAKKENTK